MLSLVTCSHTKAKLCTVVRLARLCRPSRNMPDVPKPKSCQEQKINFLSSAFVS